MAMPCNPSAPMATNQSTATGPKSAPTRAVPRRCSANRPMTTPTAIGSTYGLNAAVPTSRPSTADSTEMAGVSTASP